MLARFGVDVRRYDLRDADGFRRACEGATLAIIETPSNPTLAVTDIAGAAAAAHAGGALLCCDNTFATPLLQRPLDLGADLAWQSAHEVPRRALRPARGRRHDARCRAARAPRVGAPHGRRRAGARPRLAAAARPPHAARAAAAPGRDRRRAGAATGGAPGRAGRALPRPARPPRVRARPPADAGRRRRRAGVRAGRRRDRRTLRGGRPARAQRDQPRRRRDADRAPRPHRARGPRRGGPAARRRRPRERRRPLGRPRAGDRGVRPAGRAGERRRLRIPAPACARLPRMARDDERTSRAGEPPIVGSLPDVPGILAAMRLTPSLEQAPARARRRTARGGFPRRDDLARRARADRHRRVGGQRLLLLHGLARRLRVASCSRARAPAASPLSSTASRSGGSEGLSPKLAALVEIARGVGAIRAPSRARRSSARSTRAQPMPTRSSPS